MDPRWEAIARALRIPGFLPGIIVGATAGYWIGKWRRAWQDVDRAKRTLETNRRSAWNTSGLTGVILLFLLIGAATALGVIAHSTGH